MSNFYEHERKDNIKWIVVFVLIIGIIAALTVALVKLDRNETTETVSSNAFAIGTLNEQGAYTRNTGYIYTKDFIPANGLKIELKKDANIRYKVFFYSVNAQDEKVFISATDFNTAAFTGTIPANCEFVKIVAQPVGDAEVSTFEVRGYANQLVISHSK